MRCGKCGRQVDGPCPTCEARDIESNRRKEMGNWLAVISCGEWSDTTIYVVGVFEREEEGREKATELAEKLNRLARWADEASLAEDFVKEEEMLRQYTEALKIEAFTTPREGWNASVAKVGDKPYRVF